MRGKLRGLSLLEMLVVVLIIAVLAMVIVPRLSTGTTEARRRACEAHRRNLEVQVRLWHRTKGVWPASNLSDIGTNSAFLPEGVPSCPVDGSSYLLDPATHEISGHVH